MPNRLVAAAAVLSAALVPAAALAQQASASPLPNFNFVQLSVKAAGIAPADFETRTAAIRSCGEAVKLGRELGADVARKPFVHLTELPPQLRPIVKDLPTGHATPVLSEGGAALHVLVLCSRA